MSFSNHRAATFCLPHRPNPVSVSSRPSISGGRAKRTTAAAKERHAQLSVGLPPSLPPVTPGRPRQTEIEERWRGEGLSNVTDISDISHQRQRWVTDGGWQHRLQMNLCCLPLGHFSDSLSPFLSLMLPGKKRGETVNDRERRKEDKKDSLN